MIKREVYRVSKAGSFKNLKQQSEELQAPQVGEVCVKVAAIGLNFADIFAIQ